MPREHQFPFELRHLVYFNEVARRLHFRRAADALAITQPALTRQIQQLESILGVTLLQRHTRRVEMTPEGRALAQRCGQLFPQLHAIAEEMRALSRGSSGVLRVMFSSLAMAGPLPSALAAFAQDHPKARIELSEGGTENQLRCVQNGETDCGFCHPESLPRGFAGISLPAQPMGVVLSSGHWLRSKETIHPRDLADEDFILFPEVENPALYRRMIHFWRSHGFEPRVRQEITTRANRVALAAAGLGVSYACPCEAAFLPREAIFRKLAGRSFNITTTAVWRAAKPTPLLGRFVETLRQLY